jgi:hypothetical protein
MKKGRKVIGSKVLDEFEKGTSMVLEQPMARGMLHDPELQVQVWQEAFSKNKKFDASLSSLSLTVQPVVPEMV